MTEGTLALILAAVSTVAAVTSMIIAALAKKDSGMSSDASRRSADAAEVSAAASQEAVAEAKRTNDRLEAHDLVELNRELSEALKIEEDGDGGFVLVNHGGWSVRGIEIVDPPIPLANLPKTLNLAPRGKSAAFHLAGGNKSERPDFLLIRWSGLDVPVPLDFPYDVMRASTSQRVWTSSGAVRARRQLSARRPTRRVSSAHRAANPGVGVRARALGDPTAGTEPQD